MKLRDAPFVDRNLDGFQEMDFTFVTNGKSFRVLFNTLYPDKPKAIIRELSTNALDAHIAAGCRERPFDVKLPTLLDPNFSVRDYGESLTEAGMRIYTRVFDSTRDDSNEQHGQLGLGSKSPFAYTDSFKVTVWLDGIKRTYLAALNERGVPTLSEMNREPSSEPRGVEVSFPVQARHFKDFKEAAEKVFIGFDVKPRFLGVSPDEVKIPEPIFQDGNWKIYKSLEYNAVRMGCVIYPITNDQLHIDTGLRQGYYDHYGIVADGKIGDFDIAANREALSFDDLTIKNVQQAFAGIKEAIPKFMESEIATAPNRLEASKMWLYWHEMVPHNYVLQYRGEKLTGYLEFQTEDDLPDIRELNYKRINCRRWQVAGLDKLTFIVWNTDRAIKRKKQRLDEFSMSGNSYGGRRRRKHMPTHFLLYDPTEEHMLFLKQELGITDDQFMKVEDLPDPGPPATSTSITAMPRATDGRSLMGIYEANPEQGRYVSSRISKVSDIQPSFYWLPIEDSKPSSFLRLEHKMGGGRLDMMTKQIRYTIQEYPLQSRPVYLLTEQARKRLKVQEKDRWDNALAVYITKNKQAILDQITGGVIRDMMRHHSPEVLKAIGENPLHYQKNFPKSTIVNAYLSDDYTAAREEGRLKLKKFQEQFPLLFDATNPADYLEYIDFRKDK